MSRNICCSVFQTQYKNNRKFRQKKRLCAVVHKKQQHIINYMLKTTQHNLFFCLKIIPSCFLLSPKTWNASFVNYIPSFLVFIATASFLSSLLVLRSFLSSLSPNYLRFVFFLVFMFKFIHNCFFASVQVFILLII